MRVNLYTYASSWQNSEHSRTLWAHIRSAYFLRAMPLFITLLFVDIFILIFIIVYGKKFKVLIATEKWPDLSKILGEQTQTACIAPLTFLFRRRSATTQYIPASFFYVLAAAGLVLPEKLASKWSMLVVYLTAAILRRISSGCTSLVVHSDALPFGRALVMGANKVGIKTICIQHGTFSESDVIAERDGFLCSHNIVRSKEDAKIIQDSGKNSTIHIIPEFFRIKLKEAPRQRSESIIVLLGEGFHIIDKEFNSIYLRYLSELHGHLLDLGANVIFRPHPSERKFDWSEYFCRVDLSPLATSLAEVDAVVGYSSTLLLEAAEAGIPSFYTDPKNTSRVMLGRNGVQLKRFDTPEQVLVDADCHFKSAQPIDGLPSTETISEKVVGIVLGQVSAN
jgi:hypothetical protein